MPMTLEAANRKDVNTARYGVTLEHRHFSFIAATIAEITDPKCRAAMTAHFARACRVTNPRFYQDRFERACGLS